jgi:hypothetical protein
VLRPQNTGILYSVLPFHSTTTAEKNFYVCGGGRGQRIWAPGLSILQYIRQNDKKGERFCAKMRIRGMGIEKITTVEIVSADVPLVTISTTFSYLCISNGFYYIFLLPSK